VSRSVNRGLRGTRQHIRDRPYAKLISFAQVIYATKRNKVKALDDRLLIH